MRVAKPVKLLPFDRISLQNKISLIPSLTIFCLSKFHPPRLERDEHAYQIRSRQF